VGTSKRERQKAGRMSRREEALAAAKKQKSRKQLRSYATLGLVLVAVVVFFLVRGGGDDTSSTSTTGSTGPNTTATPTTTIVAKYGTTPCPPAEGAPARQITFSDSFQQCIDVNKTYTARIETNKGVLLVDLDAKAAPITVNNFVALARYKYFDAVPCHRIIPAFVAQCGDPQGTGTGGPGYQFADELPASGAYKVGSLAMANSGANTNGSQFFVITGAQGVALPPKYSLFGQAQPGQEAVIAALDAAGNSANNGVPPKEAVGLITVTITEK
jgi:cyclophilin family peptidyl-prolyl cis-trans isomerase